MYLGYRIQEYNLPMFSNDKEIKQLRNDVQDVVDRIDALTEKQNSQFAEIMTKLTELHKAIDKIEVENENEWDGLGTEDELYEEAKKVVIDIGKASTSLLQRKFSVGYARAASLIHTLEEEGVIGPGEGSKPREILIKVPKDTEKK